MTTKAKKSTTVVEAPRAPETAPASPPPPSAGTPAVAAAAEPEPAPKAVKGKKDAERPPKTYRATREFLVPGGHPRERVIEAGLLIAEGHLSADVIAERLAAGALEEV
jgi:hypothetical protein